jgi:hypothetical protein
VSIPAVDYAYFTSVFPEFLNVIAPGTVDALNAPALNYVGENVYGKSSQYALGLAIAHLYTLGTLKGMGPVTMDKIGDLTTQNAALEQKKGSLGMTTYGLRLRELGRMLAPGGTWVGGISTTPLPAPFGGAQPTWNARPPFL